MVQDYRYSATVASRQKRHQNARRGCEHAPTADAKELNVFNDGDRMQLNTNTEERIVGENVYKVIELVGTSTESWEKAATAAVTRASKTLRDLRVAEVCELDLQLKNGKVEAYRAKVKVSFKYEKE
jgi:dodecin